MELARKPPPATWTVAMRAQLQAHPLTAAGFGLALDTTLG